MVADSRFLQKSTRMDQRYHGSLQNDLYSMICASSSAPGRGGVFNQFIHHEFVHSPGKSVKY